MGRESWCTSVVINRTLLRPKSHSSLQNAWAPTIVSAVAL
jgi:hypothetical protein